MDHFYAVIMAGGGGTRLWPLSRQARPKQMLRLGRSTTLFQDAIERLDGLVKEDHIYIVTVADQAKALQDQCPQIPPENFLIEPQPRGTASVVGLASAFLLKKDPEAVMAVLTADHFIENINHFQILLKSAFQTAMRGYLVTLGITPTFASTGYGYIHRGEIIDFGGEMRYYRVNQFKEKPDLVNANAFFESGQYYWNSGMFIWRADQIWGEFVRLMPDLFTTLEAIYQEVGGENQTVIINKLWAGITPQTIDYGIMEQAENVVVLPAQDLGWNDVGSWDSLFDVLQPNSSGNIVVDADVLSIDCKGSILLSEKSNRMIAAIGLEDMIVVDTEDVLLLCHRKDAQRVREMVAKLKQENKNKYL